MKGVIIPDLPKCNALEFKIFSTHGDRHYVGLAGLEFFESNGKLIKCESIAADPPDINILPEYG